MPEQLIKKLDHNPVFKHAIHLMEKTNQSLFVTGKAGTGKSTLLDYFAQQTKKRPVLLAPTGVAALNVKGQTIHSFFNFYIDTTPQKILDKKTKPRADDLKLFKKLKTLIIDEVSMVRADLLDCVDTFLRLYGANPTEPFGGVQMIFVGDLYQLPPVVISKERELFSTHYETPYFFSAHGFEALNLTHVELDKVYRQKDVTFVTLLNRIRNNSVEAADLSHLNTRYLPDFKPAPDVFYINLTTTNKKADEINHDHLQSLRGKLYYSNAIITGKVGKEYYPTTMELAYKIGAQIMLLNNDQQRRWVNGTIGVIKGVKKDEEGEEYLRVKLQDNQRIVRIYPHTWEVFHFRLVSGAIVSEPMGKFTQYPIRLAWAITIHKSQGKTFDHVIIDIGRGTFVTGQMYVALSRCTSFEGMVLKTVIKKQHIRTDYRIFDFLTRYKYQQSEDNCPLTDKIKLIQQAIDHKENLTITYLKANDTKTTRTVEPLQVGHFTYRGKAYSGMRAYCQKRKEERMFRVDRILALKADVALAKIN